MTATNSWRSRVWVYGVRNPFGFTLQPGHRGVFFGDVGWNTWEEVNHGRFAGTNFGWPCYEGERPQPFCPVAIRAVRGLAAVTTPFYTYDPRQPARR